MNEFVSPNWHVVLLHYPLALVPLGLLLELFSPRRPDSDWRRSARCMILLGSLLTLPAAVSGAYAFRSVVEPGHMDLDRTWSAIANLSEWSPAQWDFMRMHIWYNGGASLLLILVSCLYLAASDSARRKLYWILLIGLVIGVGLLAAGAWHGGEAVYRYGTAVQHVDRSDTHSGIEYFAPPLQSHVVFAGLAIAWVLLASVLTVRRWNLVPKAIVARARPQHAPSSSELSAPSEVHVPAAPPPPPAGPKIPAARFWLIAALLTMITSLLGVWSLAGELMTGEAFERAYYEATEPGHERLLVHVICGAVIIILPFIIAALIRFAPSRRALAGIPIALLIAVAGWQVWMGVAILFDSHEGPLLGFNEASASTEQSHEHADDAHHDAADAHRP